MSAMSLRLPESIHRTLGDIARQEGVSMNQFVATAVAEKIAALMAEEYLKKRGKRGSRRAFERILSKVPAVEPEAADRLKRELRPSGLRPSRRRRANRSS